MSKRRIGAIPYLYPVPIVLVGSMVEGRANYATVGDCAIMGIRPALVAISLGESHFTTRGILDTGSFSINVPTVELLSLVDYFGSVSGNDVDKSVRSWRSAGWSTATSSWPGSSKRTLMSASSPRQTVECGLRPSSGLLPSYTPSTTPTTPSGNRSEPATRRQPHSPP
jgi:hypothetical protein